ncbi:MAG: DUF411 domain-containing protein [Sulfolobales archaeon]
MTSRKTLFTVASISLVLAIVALYIVLGMRGENKDLSGLSIALYKSPGCECCTRYAGYLSSLGAEVEVGVIDDIDGLMDKLGIPAELRSCHISIVEGYIVVGHVPAEAIKKLINEKPNIKGISLPGMPQGSPGMPGPKEGPFIIYSFDGSIKVFAVL